MSAPTIAADLRRLADLVEAGHLDGRSFQLTYHVPDIEAVERVATLLGGTVTTFENSMGDTQAHMTGAKVGSIVISPIGTDPRPAGEATSTDSTPALAAEPEPRVEPDEGPVCAVEGCTNLATGLTTCDEHFAEVLAEIREVSAMNNDEPDPAPSAPTPAPVAYLVAERRGGKWLVGDEWSSEHASLDEARAYMKRFGGPERGYDMGILAVTLVEVVQ